MFRKVYLLLNLIRGLPAYWLVCRCGAKEIILKDTESYGWFSGIHADDSFFLRFLWLMCRYDCYRNQVFFRCLQYSHLSSVLLRMLFPLKPDLEIEGEIGEGLVIYHGHGTVIAPHRMGKNCAVYQGVTIGKNPRPGQEISNPTIGNHVSIYTNAVVAGGITIGDNVQIGAGAVVMKDVPANSVVIGNPCIIKPMG